MSMTAAVRQTGSLEEEEEQEEDRALESPSANGVVEANGDEGADLQRKVYILARLRNNFRNKKLFVV